MLEKLLDSDQKAAVEKQYEKSLAHCKKLFKQIEGHSQKLVEAHQKSVQFVEKVLHSDEKKSVGKKYDESYTRYKTVSKQTEEQALKLFETRKKSATLVELVNSLVLEFLNLPDSLDIKLSGNMDNLRQFTNFVDRQKLEQKKLNETANKNFYYAAGCGVVATTGSPALMALATTFGTASTGAAISGLSGAAAHSAAVACIGGGALAAGGGGMAAGSAILNSLGPIGSILALFYAAKGGYSIYTNNLKQIEEYEEHIRELNRYCSRLTKTNYKLFLLTRETETISHAVNLMMRDVWKLNRNFKTLDKEQKIKIGNLLNLNRMLTAKINQKLRVSCD